MAAFAAAFLYAMKSAILDIVWTLLIAVAAFVALRVSILTIKIDQTSMEPNIYPGYWVVLSKLSYRFGDPQRGDVIVLHAPPTVEAGKDFIKRIIGLPGDTVEIKNETVFVNGVPLQEPYLAAPATYTMAPVKVPPGQYFVLGDNRDISVDSHYGWFVPRNTIVGKAWIIIWPPGKWGRAPNYHFPSPAQGSAGAGAPAVAGFAAAR